MKPPKKGSYAYNMIHMSPAQRRLAKNPEGMTDEQLHASLKEIEALEKDLEEQAKLAENADPYWTYTPSTGEISLEGRKFLEEKLKPEDIPQKLDGQMDVHLATCPVIGASGGNQCLGGETEIYDPVAGKKRRVEGIKEDFHVLAWDGEKVVVAQALRPFTKQEDEIYRVKLATGEEFSASLSHRLLTNDGFGAIADLSQGCDVFHLPTSEELARSVRVEGGLSSLQRVQGSRCDCLSCAHFYDERLREVAGSGLDASPLRADALERMVLAFGQRGGLGCKSSGSRLRLPSSRPASLDVLDLIEVRGAGRRSGASCTPCRSASDYGLILGRSRRGFSPRQSRGEFSPRASRFGGYGSSVVTSVTRLRRDVKWDFMVPGYHNYIHDGIVSRNSGKTTCGTIESFIKVTGELPLSLRQAYPKQKLTQKWPVHVRVVGEDYVNGILLNLIPTYRKWVPRDFLLNKTWERSFSAEQSVLSLGRNGQLWGTVEFMSNKQDLGSFQGPPRHKIVYDEEPREDIRKENLFRFTTAAALDELYCMTPTKGLTWVYEQLVSRAEAGESDYVRWFRLPSVGNKLANRKVLEEVLKGEDSYEARKMRILGEFISLSGLIYGRSFHRDIHMIPPFELNPRDWVTYRGLDPHTSKPSVCVEMAVNREGQRIVTGALKKACTVHEFKALMAQRAVDRKYRLAWTRCDKSANTTNKLLDDQNIFLMLQRGENAVPALMESQKFTGSIHAGVEQMREDLKVNPASGKPTLMLFDIPELQPLARSFQTLEREKLANEDVKGLRDKIAEGRHDEHAALRYIYQGRPMFYPVNEYVPELESVNSMTGY